MSSEHNELNLPKYKPELPSNGDQKTSDQGGLVVLGITEDKTANLAFVSELLGLTEPAESYAALISQISACEDSYIETWGLCKEEVIEILSEADWGEKARNN